MKETSRQRWALAALGVVYVVWGATYVGIRAVVAHLPPFGAASIRFLIAGTALFLFCLATGKWRWPSRVQLKHAAIVGSLLMGIGNGLVMWSQRSLPSGIAALFVATFPLWLTAGEAVMSRGASLRLPVILGVVLGLAGVGFIAGERGGISLQGSGSPWPAILALQGSSIVWTIGYMYAKRPHERLPILVASSLEMMAGSALLLVQSLALREDWSRFVLAPRSAWLGVLYLAFVGSIVGFTAFSFTRQTLPSHIVGTYAYVNPLVAVILGWLVYDEKLSARILAGGALIVAAVVITSWPSSQAPAPAEAHVDQDD